DQVDPRRLRLPPLDRARRAVGRAVVHHEHVEPVREREQLLEQGVDVLELVVGRDDDELLHQGAAPGSGGPLTSVAGRRASHQPTPSSTSERTALTIDTHSPSLNARDSNLNSTVWWPAGTATARSAWSARSSRSGLPSTVTFQSG